MGTYISSFFSSPKPIIFTDQRPNEPVDCAMCDKHVKTDDDAVAHDNIHHLHKKCHELWKKNNSIDPCPTCAANEESAAFITNLAISVPTAGLTSLYMLSSFGSIPLSGEAMLAGVTVALFYAPTIGNLFGVLARECVANTPTRNLKSHAVTVLSTFLSGYYLGSHVIEANLKRYQGST